MKIVIDMNLSPEWAEVLTRQGFVAAHGQRLVIRARLTL